MKKILALLKNRIIFRMAVLWAEPPLYDIPAPGSGTETRGRDNGGKPDSP